MGNKKANLQKTYVVIRRRATHQSEKGSLTRYTTYMMTLQEYNKIKNSMIDMQNYTLKYCNVIIHYCVVGQLSFSVQNRGRLTQHSTKEAIKEAIRKNPLRKPRVIQDSFEEETRIVERESDSTVPRDLKQIKNFKANILNKNENNDEIAFHISQMLEQPKPGAGSWDPTDKEQAFLQEILFRNGKQPSYVLSTEQSLKEPLNRFSN